MNEAFLISLLRLYAIITVLHPAVLYEHTRSFIEKFLRDELHLQNSEYYISLFHQFYEEKIKEYQDHEEGRREIKTICSSIVINLPVKERLSILIHLLQFIKYYQINHFYGSKTDHRLRDTIDSIASLFSINSVEYQSLSEFIFENLHQIGDKKSLLISGKRNIFHDIKFIFRENLKGQIYFLYLPSVRIFMFYYSGEEKIELNNNQIFPLSLYFFQKSSVITAEHIYPIYYHEVIKNYLENIIEESIHFSVIDIEFKFKKSDNGIKKLTMHGESGELLGIMGASGTGKSTLMNIFNGTIKPRKGSILINGHNIYDEHINIHNVIGYVPQDDLLFEELTVYKNLYYNAKLCFGKSSDAEIEEKVKSLLTDLELYNIRNLKVGNPLDKYISGGERKRVNIALELIREPSILMLDEPTSGLSSNDAENIIRLLNEQTNNGKYVIINIHQPSSEVFKQMDQLLILDKGGYPIYFGKSMEALKYFKHIAGRIDADSYECDHCGNINPEDIFRIIEEKKTSMNGNYLNHRIIEPPEWYRHYIKNIGITGHKELKSTSIPVAHFEITGKTNQLVIFLKRQVLSKLSDIQYMTMMLLISPVLGFILGFFCKYSIGTDKNPQKYLFIDNINLPVYIFMSVISALFVGMIISAEEIQKDRKIREREKFISLSKMSYINSKVIFLFIISAIQIFLFVLVGNNIMQIKGTNISYGLILFSTACCSNMIGLNISSAFKSLVAIYILIPLMLVPLILLSGVIVPFDKFNNYMKSEKFVPVIGDLMVSRWAYEALAVEQFSNNNYQRYWFNIEKRKSNASYMQFNLIPFLSQLTEDVKGELNKDQIKSEDLTVINSGLQVLNNNIPNPYNYSINKENICLSRLKEVEVFLNRCKFFLSEQLEIIKNYKDSIYDNMYSEINHKEEAILEFKQQYYNNRMADFVLGRDEFRKLIVVNGKIIRKAEPIYDEPDNFYGRAHFYSPVKKIGPFLIDTFYFNIVILWLITLMLYLLLISNVLGKLLKFLGKRKD